MAGKAAVSVSNVTGGVEAGAEPSGLRGNLAEALEGWMTPEQLRLLLDEILSVKKRARGWCPSCKKHVNVEVLDARAVVAGMTDLANQGFGRPGEAARVSDDERIVFERVVYMAPADGEASSV